MRSRALLLVAALAAAGGCTSAPDACVTVRTGTLCASTPATAQAAGQQLDQLADAVRAELPELSSDPVDVWLQTQPQVVWFFPAGADVAAMTNSLTGRIHARESSVDLDIDLAHELVHALLGPAWDDLPPTLEEGLCDQIASRAVEDGSALRADRLLKAMAAVGGPQGGLRLDSPGGGWSQQQVRFTWQLGVDIDLRDVFSRDSSLVRPFHGDRGRPAWYGLAFVAAGRLLAVRGADGLLELVQRVASLDEEEAAAELAAAAGLSDAAAWPDAILAEITDRDRVAIAAANATDLATQTVAIVRDQVGQSGPLRARVEAARPRFRLRRTSASSVDLLDHEWFEKALDRAIARDLATPD